MLADLDNVWFDTSSALWAITPERASQLIHELGPARVMFGTDYPVAYVNSELERFLALDLSEQERRTILYDNAARFLGL
ncbi:MAG: amidohydrolase family protein [Clostridia bacterium]|nr:amidohydrolase family protein [Clostridia bacterium]